MAKLDLLGHDFGPTLLGGLGFATKCISYHYSLSGGQVGYRLKQGNIRLRDYRNGESPIAEMVLRSVGHAQPINVEDVAAQLRKELRNTLKIKNNKKKSRNKEQATTTTETETIPKLGQ